MTGPDLAAVFAAALGDYYARLGRDLSDPATSTTIRVNSSLVQKRGETVAMLLRELLGIESLAGLRVLEAGSGFGALAAYLASSGAARVVGIDTNPEYVRVGRESAERLGLGDRLEYERMDMQSMEQFPDASFDLVVANNSFLYITSRAAASAALREFRRLLVPGGALLFYQANRWRIREPFTDDPIVHLLPAPLADVVSRATGWRHNHGRVRLTSSGQMRRHLSKVGLKPVGTMGFGHHSERHTRVVMRNFGTFYAQAARRQD